MTGATEPGNGTVTFSVAVNNTGAARTGTLTIAGCTATISQGDWSHYRMTAVAPRVHMCASDQ